MTVKALVVSDNDEVRERFREVVKSTTTRFEYFTSKEIIKSLSRTVDMSRWIRQWDMGFSVHSQFIFEPYMVRALKCINIHPGYNPYNRGWYPHVFSIINGLPAGATIHEMDEKIDNGNIIAQEEVEVLEHDTGGSLYEKILDVEFKLLEENIHSILSQNYAAVAPSKKGNFNSKKDYDKLCEIDLEKVVTMRQAVKHIAALTHSPHHNAYFLDKRLQKVYMSFESREAYE